VVATAWAVEMGADGDIIYGSVDSEKDGEFRVRAIIEGQLGVGEVEGTALCKEKVMSV